MVFVVILLLCACYTVVTVKGTKQKQSSLDQNLNYRKEVSVMMKLNKLATMNHNNHNNHTNNNNNKGGRK